MLAPRVIGGQLELVAEPVVQDMERRDDPIKNVHPDAVLPHPVETLFERGLAHDLPPGSGLIEVADNGDGLGESAAVGELEGRVSPQGFFLRCRHSLGEAGFCAMQGGAVDASVRARHVPTVRKRMGMA